MKSNYKSLKVVLVLLLVLPLVPSWNYESEGFSNQVIQQGSTGDDVIELQSRLQYIGYYNGAIDGVFGWQTYWALRNFQYEFDLEVDGLAGETTKQALERATQYDQSYVYEQIRQGNSFTHYGGEGRQDTTAADQDTQTNEGAPQNAEDTNESSPSPSAVNVPSGFSQNDIQLMAQAVYGEARGEPYVGQVAVAAVILNRMESSTFPDSVSGIVFEPLAFTAVADGQIYMSPDETAQEAVIDAINGWDPSGDALYYFNPDTATSSWIWSRPQIKRIGKHVFCK
ncbi:spore cortex-lytic enzyme [Halalkalibacillus halophilus]|uniref:spore cortex-lytic enzyme n=1 Tax=Halalkalibacillus halophilus TaxID=392827 RepID=UPI0003F919BE|nr:spore cortex-lytic enzyme [Halalkalibacillus halophilus]